LPGTVADALLLESATVVAVVGAALNVTVPCKVVPPATDDELRVTVVTRGPVVGAEGSESEQPASRQVSTATAASDEILPSRNNEFMAEPPTQHAG
jgi:hypothetical protein